MNGLSVPKIHPSAYCDIEKNEGESDLLSPSFRSFISYLIGLESCAAGTPTLLESLTGRVTIAVVSRISAIALS